MVFKNEQAKLDAWHKKLEDKVKARGHVLISGKMTSNQRESCYLIYCPTHDCEKETSYFNYMRSRNGCLFCGHDSVSEQLQGREFSEETLEKMKCGEWDQGDQTLNYLMQTIQECMDRKLMISGDVKAAAIAIWSLVHGMVALSLRRRWDKLIHEDEVIPSMNKALTWILNSIDQSNT